MRAFHSQQTSAWYRLFEFPLQSGGSPSEKERESEECREMGSSIVSFRPAESDGKGDERMFDWADRSPITRSKRETNGNHGDRDGEETRRIISEPLEVRCNEMSRGKNGN
mmetsp:Transcript_13318/g.26096  ORF Transcript_13318/g.26096 Transcript_13318/m.26096 type:complete len:110 (+) Transcript_13318:125-454(+)